MATALQPWGRLKLVSADSVDDADHTYLYRSVSVVGRDPQRADVLLSSMLISSVHCRIDVTGKNDRGEPIVMLEDLSRNRIWANEELIGKGNSVQLTPNATVHFTKPGALQKMSPPMVYVFELLDQPTSLSIVSRSFWTSIGNEKASATNATVASKIQDCRCGGISAVERAGALSLCL
ncbi:hypothetical protein Poli38472_006836 [Pythium oligandrum]|uniref:FHA domain-containing protein n=1 Tax=Pythium oligandrum TaxID=41045 RepID=A0A8K1C5A5_PYTOL|nr:hypothetical protein Poli38472_006836 [Pythium oligandrum]|eukprot:TMW56826.1 hypothetical protein Poli38472_006836 [Pythium oligandrum]